MSLRNTGFSILCLLAAQVQAANICIGPSSTGNGSGSDWNNLKAWSGTPVRGDTWYLRDGTYTGKTLGVANSGTTLIIIKKATVADHGPSAGWSDSYASQATFNSELLFTTGYWTVDGQTGGGPGNWMGVFGFKIAATHEEDACVRVNSSAANNITIRHVELLGQGHVPTTGGYDNGVQIWGGSNITVSYAWIHETGTGAFFISGANHIFEYIYVGKYYGDANNHSEIASIWGFSSPFGDMTFRYNVFTHVESTGGLMWDNSSNPSCHLYVYGNVFYKPAGDIWQQANGIIGGWTGGNGEEMRNVLVYNNTFINCDQLTLSYFPNIYSGCEAKNNLWYNCQAPAFSRFPAHDYNHFVSSGGTQGEANGTLLTGNPFVNYPGLDFTLTANTQPGINLGAPYNTDALGNTRSTWTRGAYEFASSGSAPVISSDLSSTGTNGTAYTYTIAASGSPNSFGASPLPTGLSINGSSGVISGTPNVSSPPTTNNVTISATNSFGFDSKTLVLVINAPQAAIAVLSTNVVYHIYTNGIQDYVFVVTNSAGSGTLTGDAATTSPWSIVGNSHYSLTTGNTTNIMVRYAPTVVNADSTSVTFTGGGGWTNTVVGWPYPVFPVGTIHATNGLILAPLTVTGAYISQPSGVQTPSDGGRASYGINFTQTGTVTFKTLINAPGLSSDSYWVNLDGQPTDPTMIFDVIPDTIGFENRTVGWRGNGTVTAPQFPTNTWGITAGIHELIFRGREGGCQLQDIIVQFTAPATVPGLPIAPIATGSNATVLVSWTTPSSDGGSAIGGYNISRSTSTGGEILLKRIAVTNNFSDTNVVNGTQYFYTISATNSVGEGGQSPEVFATPSTLPSAPLNLQVTPGYTMLNLQWNVPADNGGDNVIGYYVWRSTISGSETPYFGLVYSAAYNDVGVSPGTAYYYKVSAFNSNGEGPLSNESGGAPLGVPLAVAASSVLKGNIILKGNVILK